MTQGSQNRENGIESNRLKLPSDEMAFRRIYRKLIEREVLTTVFRPEPRACSDERGYCVGQIVQARILETPGSDTHKISPRFLDGGSKTIRIESVEVKAIGSLTRQDFQGSSPDVQDVQDLRYHLGIIYNLDPSEITESKLITRIKYSFINNKEH